MNAKVRKPKQSFVKNFFHWQMWKWQNLLKVKTKCFFFIMFFGFLGPSSSKAVKLCSNRFQIKQVVFKNNVCLTYVFKKKATRLMH